MRERWLTLQQTEVPQSALGYLLRPESAGVDDQFVQTRGLQAAISSQRSRCHSKADLWLAL